MTTLVRGPIKLVTDRPDTVRKINLRAPELRLHGAGIVTDHNDDIPVVDGHVEFEALPGPAVLTLVTAGGAPLRSVDIVVPDEETALLSECLDQIYVYEPAAVGRAQYFARKAREHADRAEAGAATVGDAQTVLTARDDAVTASEDAVTARDDAVTASEDAVTARDDAVTASEDAVTARDDAVTASEDAVTARDDAVTASEDAEQVATALPATIQSELDARLPTELDTRMPPLVSAALADDPTIREAASIAVPPLVSAALADDPTIREAASIAVQNISLVEDPPGSGLFMIGAP